MRTTLFTCGPAANESELKCFEFLKNRLQSEAEEGEWVLLSNLTFSVTNQLQSDEIDLVALGPSGVRVIEMKHWTSQWRETHPTEVETAADRVTMKARKIGTTLRRFERNLPRVDGAIILTQDPSKVKKMTGQPLRGVTLYSLNEWKPAIGFDGPRLFSSGQISLLASILHPRSGVAVYGSVRRLAGYVNLELQTPKEQRFHRVYKGSHPSRRDRVVLHLYDLSAVDDKGAEAKARREFEALHRLQLFAWAPRVLDSYQDAPGYEGEMYFFTIVDPAAPSIEDRKVDATWAHRDRLAFARSAVRALAELHSTSAEREPIIHRNLSTTTVLVKHDNSVIQTGFDRAGLPSETSVTSTGLTSGHSDSTVAPEIKSQGITAADHRSDIFSLCASLCQLFDRRDVPGAQALEVLSRGMAEAPSDRVGLTELDAALTQMLGERIPTPPAPPARFWTEDQVVDFRDRRYRIVSRLGSGGVGTAYKVVEIDRHDGKELGTYVAKVAHDRTTGIRVLHAYSLVRSHLRHTALSTIFEVASEWQENQFVALLAWVSGAPLADFAGVFPLLAEEQQEASAEALAIRWLKDICQALDVLHRNGLVHGDVSPRNLIVSGSDVVLTDYDFAGRIAEPVAAPGTVLYCSPSYQEKKPASCSDDLYALAATFFHVLFEKEPFRHGMELDKARGLNWEGVDRDQYPNLCRVLDQATSRDAQSRFRNAAEVIAALLGERSGEPVSSTDNVPVKTQEGPSAAAPFVPQERRVDWLLGLLQSYPGSRWGNVETRGLDTDFAARTYVETDLEKTLEHDVRTRRLRLIVLCGNAGDGKTALLQQLAVRLGLGDHPSSERLIEGNVPGGPLVRMNLDGSASWRGSSADQILSEFLAPFQKGLPKDDIVHLLAINDGRLLEWIEAEERAQGGRQTALTAALYESLQYQKNTEAHIRFINLNQRSLVGGVAADRSHMTAGLIDRVVDRLYGGEEAAKIWAPCGSCSARDRCQVFRAARIFGPTVLPSEVDPAIRQHSRQRLLDAFQAVHLRGQTHITMRELRAALVYILFGVHFCDDYHGERADALPYWERAFSPDSAARQGELLAELARFDPALEAHPQIDRHLVGRPSAEGDSLAPHYPDLTVESARRRAY